MGLHKADQSNKSEFIFIKLSKVAALSALRK